MHDNAESAPVQDMQVTLRIQVKARTTEEAVAAATALVRSAECVVHVWNDGSYNVGPFYRSGVWRDAFDAAQSDGIAPVKGITATDTP